MRSLVIFCLVLTTTLAVSYADQTLIETTCKNTPNYRLCTATLRAHPGSTTADITGLALIMVQAVKDKTRATISAIYSLKQRRNTHPKMSRALQECARVYNAVMVADVPEAVEALTKGDPKFAENGMADTAVEADVCQGRINEASRLPSPMTGMNKAVKELAQVARAIIRNLL